MSDFGFLDVDRHKWKEQVSLTGFLKKLSFGQMANLGQKTAHPHNSGSEGRMFLKFCTMKRANR